MLRPFIMWPCPRRLLACPSIYLVPTINWKNRKPTYKLRENVTEIRSNWPLKACRRGLHLLTKQYHILGCISVIGLLIYWL